ncbi:MAG TPA: C25 family cysteine peptidase, partial [Pirellulales bacterium]|nr:C25 family cysteine peptidase [Pirellulales bacterium]
DDDRLPDLAVGRLTADSPDELAAMIRKIQAYETSVDFGRWRSQLHFVAGMGGFGPLADAALEAAAKTLISHSVPAAFDVSMTYASFQSPYCPDPRRFRSVAVERFNEGSLFWVYLGHGDQRALDPVRVPGRLYPSFSTRDAPRLDCRHGAPVACFLACYTGAFDQPQDCLAEELLRQPGGPVAVVCGTRMTMPYAMTVMGSELLDECFAGRHQLLGQLLLAAKRRTMEPARAESPRAAIESAAKALGLGGADLEAERAEHLDLFQLLGDPLLRLPLPRHVELEVPPAVIAGRRLAVRGDSAVAGMATVELVVRRGRQTAPSPRRMPFDSDRLAEYDEVYKQANEPRLASARLEVPKGRFDLELVVPDGARGACHVRAFVEGRDDCAVGAAALRIETPDLPAAR